MNQVLRNNNSSICVNCRKILSSVVAMRLHAKVCKVVNEIKIVENTRIIEENLKTIIENPKGSNRRKLKQDIKAMKEIIKEQL